MYILQWNKNNLIMLYLYGLAFHIILLVCCKQYLMCHYELQVQFLFSFTKCKSGTVTPTHYQVVEDTLRLPPDIMQRLTFKCTHM